MSINYYFGTSPDSYDLSEDELKQIRSISSSSWTFLKFMNQSVSVGASPVFDQIKLGNGTLTNPSITFNGDPDTGIFWGGMANSLSIGTGGVERIWLQNNDVIIENSTLTLLNDLRIGVSPTFNFTSEFATGNTYIAGKLGINQAPGSAQLEVTGDIQTTGKLKILKNNYTLSTNFVPGLSGNRTLSFPDANVDLSFLTQDVSETGNPEFSTLKTSNGSSVHHKLRTGVTERWWIGMNNAELGTNTGGNFVLTSFSDVGGQLGAPFTIKRSNGYVGLGLTGSNAEATEQLEVTGNIKATGLKFLNSTYTISTALTTLTADRTLTFPDADVNLSYLSQNLSTTATPQFAKLGIAQAAGTEVLEVTGNIKGTSYKSDTDFIRLIGATTKVLTGTTTDVTVYTFSNAKVGIYQVVISSTVAGWGCVAFVVVGQIAIDVVTNISGNNMSLNSSAYLLRATLPAGTPQSYTFTISIIKFV